MLDILFPNVCRCCGKEPLTNDVLCELCLSSIRFTDDWAFCNKCGVPFGYFDDKEKDNTDLESGKTHHLCSKCINNRYSFKRARSIAIYEGSIRDIIISFKYEGKLSFGELLLEILATNFPKDLEEFDCVVPVPLHIDKLKKREYNQSVILANGIAKHKDVKSDIFGLKRTRDTVPQIEIKDENERRRNVKGAFSVAANKSYKDRSVLLVDDVFTTGSTSDECSKMLLKSGAYKVQVLTLTRAWAV